MAKKLRVGIVGCGKIARSHVMGYRADGRAEVVSVYDVSARAAAKLAEETGADVAHSLKAMAANDRLDAVSICTPPAAHYDNAKPFLAARVPVICEKPLAVNAAVAARFASAVKKSRTLFMTAFCHRFHPPIIELKKLLKKGTLGRPVFFRNIFAGFNKLKGGHRGDPALSGGGCMIDNGAHSVDLLRFLVGEPISVTACTGNVLQNMPVEDMNVMVLHVGCRAMAEITSSYSIKAGSNWAELYGTKGTAAVSYWNKGQPDLAYKLAGGDWMPVDCSKHPQRIQAEIGHFLDCVRNGRKPAITVDDGLKAARIMTAAYKSAATGRRVRIRL